MRSLSICGLVVALVTLASATTLQQLSLDDMIRKSTSIIRGKAQRTYGGLHGSMIYTHYSVEVMESWKGNQAGQIDIVVPGGVSSDRRQSYAGAPALVDGQEYVLFLWTSKSGLTQVIGLSQGLFVVKAGATGDVMVTRPGATERMLGAMGQPVTDSDLQMRLSDLRDRVAKTLGGRGGQ